MKSPIQIPEYPHAIMSPSKASMWLNCHGALGAARGVPSRPASRYAAEGTVYHDVARRALIEDRPCADYIGDRYEVQGFEFVVDADNADFAQQYVDAVRAIPGKRFIEVDLEYSRLLGLPKQAQGTDAPVGAGTGDCVVIDYENRIVHSHDLKFGRGDIVYANENPQLRLYAIAAVDRYEILGIEDDWKVSMAIHQPRAFHFDSEIITVGELRAWTEQQKAAANRAYTLWTWGPERIEVDHLTPGEKQCRWCPLSGKCAAQSQKVLDQFPTGHAEQAIQTLTQLDDVQVAEALDRADEIEHWLSAVRAEGLQRALQGRVLPNWKLVEGRRGNRSLDTSARVQLDVPALHEIGVQAEEPTALPVDDALHFALGDAAYKPRELQSVAKLQKPLEKKAPLLWAALQAHIQQPDGKPSLAPIADPRPPTAIVTPEFPITAPGASSLL